MPTCSGEKIKNTAYTAILHFKAFLSFLTTFRMLVLTKAASLLRLRAADILVGPRRVCSPPRRLVTWPRVRSGAVIPSCSPPNYSLFSSEPSTRMFCPYFIRIALLRISFVPYEDHLLYVLLTELKTWEEINDHTILCIVYFPSISWP